MPSLTRLLPAAVAVLLLAPATTTALADTPGQGACSTLQIPGRAVEHAFKLPGGQRAVLRDPYGGLIFRNRLFVSFVVKVADREALIDHVQWLLDGDATTLRRNQGGKFALKLQSTRFPAGAHKLTAHVFLRDGTTVDKTIDVSATDCQPVSFFGDVAVDKGTRATTTLSVGSGGPSMRAVNFNAVGQVRAAVPPSSRGRKVGTLGFFDGTFPFRAQQPKALTLRMPARPAGRTIVLLRRGELRVVLHPGRKRMLELTGLPARTRGVNVRLAAGVIAPPHGCPVKSGIVATVIGTAHGGTAAVTSGSEC